jgi:hypothetical protein
MVRRSIRLAAIAGFAIVALLIAVPASPSGGGASSAAAVGRRILLPDTAHPASNAEAISKKFTLIGHNDLGHDIDFGDLWAHDHTVYVGSRCGGGAQGGGGVRVVDYSDPAHPTMVSTLPNPQYTRDEDLVVRDVDTPSFKGVLAVVGLQQCFGSGHTEVVTGLQFFDVTKPAAPVKLSTWKLPTGSIGCHEIDFVQRPSDGKVLAGCARNLVDQEAGTTAIHIIDATNPSAPTELSTYSLGLPVDHGIGCMQVQFNHSVRFVDNGLTLYGSYWDAGTVRLDVKNPKKPKLVTTIKITPGDEDGNQHSANLLNNGKWLVINPEDFSPGDCPSDGRWGGWGEAWMYDNTNPLSPRFMGTFSTPNSRSSRRDGTYTVHNTESWGNTTQFFSSWYGDGVVWWTMNDQGATTQIGQFAPAGADVWGVYPDAANDLVLMSDIGSGLWIVRPKGL